MPSEIAARLVALCAQKKLRTTTAESCTGGMVAAAITDVPGASNVFDFGFVAYANRAKVELLGVPESLIKAHGAVSAEVAAAMAEGAVKRAAADAGVAITGIAGPSGGTKEKPVGTVFIAVAKRQGVARSNAYHFSGNRDDVRRAATEKALSMLYETALAL